VRDHDRREKVEGIERLYGVARPWMEHAAGFGLLLTAIKFVVIKISIYSIACFVD
jgi:hypothetical protein